MLGLLLLAGLGTPGTGWPGYSYEGEPRPVMLAMGQGWQPNEDQVNEAFTLKRSTIHELGHALGELVGFFFARLGAGRSEHGACEGRGLRAISRRWAAGGTRFGAELVYDDVTSLELDGPVKAVTLGNGDRHEALAVIYATGSAYRKLGLPDEERLSGYGVSWCATCDGAFFRQKTVAVVGGGDSAMEEATFLTRFADKVYLIHRSDTFRASAAMLDRAKADPKIEFVTNASVAHIYGGDLVNGVGIVDTVTGDERTLDVSGLFIAIGADPRTHLVHGMLDLTDQGTIAVDGRSSRTSLPGVFAAGDVVDPTYKQAITAAGSGCVAAIDAQHYLEGLGDDLRQGATPEAVSA